MKATFVLAAALAALGARADIVSTFDTTNEGWLAANVSPTTLNILSSTPATWDGGHIDATESGTGLFVLAAPTAYLGNLSGYYGGTVSYTLSDTVADPGATYINLLIRGNGFAMAYETTAPSTYPGTTYTIPMTESGWIDFSGKPVTQAEFLNALASVDEFGINADWKTQGQDSVTLDNVRVAATPEPTTLGALGLGLLAIGRRRKTRA